MATRLTLRSGDTSWAASVDGASVRLGDEAPPYAVAVRSDGRIALTLDGRDVTGAAAREGPRVWVAVGAQIFTFDIDEGRASTRTRGRDPHALTPPMPATVLRVNVVPGARVTGGDALLVLEAMKMEIAIRAPHAGVVRAVNCREGDLVQPGTVLVELDEP